jgi:tripartite-type tricarboxylate transporter receptor subunit TctC
MPAGSAVHVGAARSWQLLQGSQMTQATRRAVFIALSAFAMPATSAAEDGNFFAGKSIHVVVGFDVGGGYDLYARTVARHWTRHIPGNPAFVVQNMPGAGSRTAANWLYNVAPKDGTAIATIVQSSPVDQALGEPGIRFDVVKFNWLGNPIVDNLVTLSWSASGLATLEDVRSKGGLFCGSTGGGPTTVFPRVLNQLLGTQIKIIAGFRGQSAVNIAMERGEVNCIGGTTWSSVKATMRPMLEARKINLLVQWGTKADPEISDYARRKVPLIHDLGQDRLDRFVLQFIGSGAAFGRPLLAAPGVPPERVAILRRAFDRTMADPAFRTEAAKLNMEIKPLGGDALQTMATEIAASPPQGLARARELIGSAQ